MNINHIWAICLIFFTVSSCTTPNIVVDQKLLQENEAMAVKGRQGWQINQVINFGDYSTSKVKRGWTSTYNIPFVVHFEGAKEKLHFTQYGANEQSADVFCISQFTNHNLPLLGDFFNIPLEYEDYFAGTIYQASPTNNWDFIIYTPDGGTIKNTTAGFIKNDDSYIEIRGVRTMEKQKYLLKLDVYGYEFFLDGVSIGAVQTVNNGRVWIDKTQPDSIKLAIAAVATGVILRHDPKESVEP